MTKDGDMTVPWSERQRTALRAFREAIAVRAQREEEIRAGLAERTRAADQEFRELKESLQDASTAALAQTQARAEQSRQEVEARHIQNKNKATDEFSAARGAAARIYGEDKTRLVAEFEEARWTINTVYESDKKVAREQLAEADQSLKDAVVKLRAQRDAAREYCKRWSFVGPLTVPRLGSETDEGDEERIDTAKAVHRQAEVGTKASHLNPCPKVVHHWRCIPSLTDVERPV